MARISRGWRNTWRGSDPLLGRTFDTISDWTSRLGAGVTISRSTNFTVPTGGLGATIIPFDGFQMDDELGFLDLSLYSGGGNRGWIKIPEGLDGVYLAVCSVLWDANVAGTRRELRIGRGENAAPFLTTLKSNPYATDAKQPVNSLMWQTAVAGNLRLRAGDEVAAGVYQDSGANRTLNAFSGTSIYMNVCRVGDYRNWDN